MKKVLKITFWIIAILLFPITAGLYFVWPSRILKDRMSAGWRKFWWATYGFVAVAGILSKIWFYVLVPIALSYSGGAPYTTHKDVQPSEYQTAEDFRKLTGVEFPELEMVDAFYFDENAIGGTWYNEYKFVAKEGLTEAFYKRLNCACKADPTHWKCNVEGKDYGYIIRPDRHPVDRSRGMCDRVLTFDDKEIIDWDGDFIVVEVYRDTITLRKGWEM